MRIARTAGLAAALALSGCAPVEETPMVSIIGATLIDGTGAAPVPESVVLVAGSRVREAGARATVPTPARATNVDGRRKYVTPRIIDLSSAGTGPHIYRNLPADIEPTLIAQLRGSRAVFAPGLCRRSGEDLARAMRQTRQLASAGVLIGLACHSGPARELQLLVDSGLSPMEVLIAATRNGAIAIRQDRERGTVTARKFADLQLLSADPLGDVRNLARPDRVMHEGSWLN